MSMDLKRDPKILRQKKIRRGIFAGAGAIVLVVISVAVARLEPAAPLVPAGVPWIEPVKRGDMTRDVHGSGTLVPEDIRWITATTSGRVERLVLRPGAAVEPDSVILELSNPDLEQSARNAELSWKSAMAQLENQQAQLRKERLTQQNAVKNAESEYNLAQADLDANEQLAAEGLVSQLTVKQKQSVVDTARNRFELARQQLALAVENEASQLAPLQATVNQQKAAYDNLLRQLEDLKVKATISGVLQIIGSQLNPVELGGQVAAGAQLARVADPSTLKAEVRISETQTRDLAIGQRALIDTRNGTPLRGVVTRIDPASQGGTVGVDVAIDDPLHPGDRPDLSVDGTIVLERLENVVYMSRPAFGQENSSITIFKLTPDGNEAIRTPVKLGKAAVTTIVVEEGLQPGDQVVLSDMSQYDAYDRVRIR
jgi:HlyD family secretion protein